LDVSLIVINKEPWCLFIWLIFHKDYGMSHMITARCTHE